MRALWVMLTATMALGLFGCGKEVGEACAVEGDGFTRRDPCVEMCIEWTITCPDGREITPMECAGAVCGDGGDCPEGQVCQVVDSVPANARCVRAEVCAQP